MAYTVDMNSSSATDYDSPWKEALAQFLPDALALFFPEVHAQIDWSHGYTLLDKELQQVTRDADLGRRLADTLVQVWRRDDTDVWVLIHIEIQGQPDAEFARRMFVYYYRIFDRYERPVMSVAILADAQPAWRPARFEQELWGCTILMRYPLVKLLDWQARDAELAASKNPFAVVVRAHLAAQATHNAVTARGQAKLALIRGLYRLGHDRARVLELLRLIDWLLALPGEEEKLIQREIETLDEEQKMAYVTSWERMGKAEGRAEGVVEGKAEGVVEGRAEGQKAMLRRIALARFSDLPDQLAAQIEQADQDALDTLAERLATAASIEDVLSDTAP